MRDISSPLDGIASPFGPQRTKTLAQLLFAANEPGFTFEPWDITTLYQDRAGTTPVTAAGQSVGLRLDKSKGLALGAELVTNGDFSGGDTGWTPQDANIVLSTSGGAGVATYSATSTFYQGVSVQAGKTYRATAFIKRDSGSGTPFMNFRSGTTLASGTVGEFSGTGYASSSYVFASAWFVAASTTIVYLHFPCTAAATTVVSVDNISVRELPGNHQVAVNDAKRGVYGWMPKTGRRNLLAYTEQFDNAAWTKSDATVTANAAVAPDGTTTADKLIESSGVTRGRIGYGVATAVGNTISVYAKAAEWNRVSVGISNNGGLWGLATFNLSTGLVDGEVSYGGVSVDTPVITLVGNGWYRCSVRVAAGTNTPIIMPFNQSGDPVNPSPALTGDGTSGVYIWGAQLEVGSTATAYQSVVSQYDITEAGVPTCYYVQADGVDDAYVTPTITPNTDKAQVFAGVRKLGNGMHIEYSASADANNGAFYRYAGEVAAGDLSVGLRGTQLTKLISAGAAIPVNRVETSLLDIAAATRETEILLRINGASVSGGAFGAADAGTGNFLAYPAYIYSRGDTSLPFNGLDFGHAVRFGPNLDAATIARVESLIARNTPEVTL